MIPTEEEEEEEVIKIKKGIGRETEGEECKYEEAWEKIKEQSWIIAVRNSVNPL